MFCDVCSQRNLISFKDSFVLLSEWRSSIVREKVYFSNFTECALIEGLLLLSTENLRKYKRCRI